MVDAESSTGAVKARKVPRLTAKQEIQTIRNLPRVQRGIVIMKIAGVFLLAIGFEGLVTGQYLYSILFVPLGVIVRCCRSVSGPACASHAVPRCRRMRRSARAAARRRCDPSR